MKRSLLYLFLVIVTTIMSGCSPSDDPSDKTIPLAVLEIQPDHGPKNTVVRIAGTGFGLVPDEHHVTLNGKQCTVTDAFGEMLTISIPPGAGSGKIKIEREGHVTSTTVFTYEYTEIYVTTIAGGEKGYNDAIGTSAQFQTPTGVAVDTLGNTYVVDQGNHRIRKISADGSVTTFAGSTKGYSDGTALSAQFNLPSGITRDVNNNFYITDSYNDKIRKINSQGVVTTLTGSITGYQDGAKDNARFDVPYGIAADDKGTVFVADYLNNRIRKVTPDGTVTTFAGKGNFQQFGGAFADGQGTDAYFYYPAGLSLDDDGILYVADQFNHRIRRVDEEANVPTIGGSGPVGQFNGSYADGDVASSRFGYPTGVCFNARDSSVIVADAGNHRIRIIKDEKVTTLTGNYGYADGSATEARFSGPSGVAVDRDGNIIVADSQNHRIRKIVFE